MLAALRAHRIAAENVLVLSFRIRDLWHAQRARPDLRYVLNLGRRPDPTAAARFWGVGFEDRSASPGRLALAGSLGLAMGEDEAVSRGVADSRAFRAVARTDAIRQRVALVSGR